MMDEAQGRRLAVHSWHYSITDQLFFYNPRVRRRSSSPTFLSKIRLHMLHMLKAYDVFFKKPSGVLPENVEIIGMGFHRINVFWNYKSIEISEKRRFMKFLIKKSRSFFRKNQLLRFLCFLCFVCLVCSKHTMFSSKTIEYPSGEYRDHRHGFTANPSAIPAR